MQRKRSKAVSWAQAVTFALGGVVLPALALTTSCDYASMDTSARETGSASVIISALSANEVAGASLTISALDIAPAISAPLSVSNGQWQATIGGIPAGSNRTFTLSAADSSGTELYHGQTGDVTITAHQTQEVTIVAQQAAPGKPFSDSAPVIDLLQASQSPVAPGGAVNLTVTAHDPDQSDQLSYAWSTATGSLSNATVAATTWTAPTMPGTYPITIVVTDAQRESVSATLQVTVSPSPAVPIPFTARWTLAGLLASIGVVVLSRGKRQCD